MGDHQGEPPAGRPARSLLGLAAFIGVYWAARLGVDLFYFEHADWPQGTPFVVGHVLLTGLFAALAATYIGLVCWRLIAR